MIRVGVAGWDYPDWKRILYPSPKPRGFDPVRYLADYIDLIEINSTFYRPPSADVAKKWAARAQDLDGFRYSAKLYRRFTHDRDTAWKAAELKEAKAGLKVLNKAGVLDALLMQFPWSFRNTEENREWLGDLVDAFGEFPLVVEVRHEGWNNAEFYESLAESGVGFVNVDQPLFKKSIKPSALATSRIGYVRVHGRNYSDWFRKGAGRDARYDSSAGLASAPKKLPKSVAPKTSTSSSTITTRRRRSSTRSSSSRCCWRRKSKRRRCSRKPTRRR